MVFQFDHNIAHASILVIVGIVVFDRSVVGGLYVARPADPAHSPFILPGVHFQFQLFPIRLAFGFQRQRYRSQSGHYHIRCDAVLQTLDRNELSWRRGGIRRRVELLARRMARRAAACLQVTRCKMEMK